MSQVVVFGANGMLGHSILRVLAADLTYETIGVVRSERAARTLETISNARVVVGYDVDNLDMLVALFESLHPNVVINATGIVKQSIASEDPIAVMRVNTFFPHRLAKLCSLTGARLVHISTDCVFSGFKGQYTEKDIPDATDLYGRSKILGEVTCHDVVTLRTSTIGHELETTHSLLTWFLAQQGRVKGYTRAIFSGLPTVELARVIRDFILPHRELHGLYHVAASPISKYDLLNLLNRQYCKELKIDPDDNLKIDRSLNGSRFMDATGYIAPNWPDLIAQMHEFHLKDINCSTTRP